MQATVSPVESTPRRQERDLQAVPVSPRGNGYYGVLSSDGATIYTTHVSKAYEYCTCPAGRAKRACYHLAAVKAQFAELPVYSCGGCGVRMPLGTKHTAGTCTRIHQAGIAAFREAC